MEYGRQLLTNEGRVRRRFVPTDTGHRIIILSGGIGSRFPACRTRSARGVHESMQGVTPRERPSVGIDDGTRPELLAPITALVDEFLELAIGHLVLVNPIIVEHYGGKVLQSGEEQLKWFTVRRDPHHALGALGSGFQDVHRDMGIRRDEKQGADVVRLGIAWQLNSPIEEPSRIAHFSEWCLAQVPPRFVSGTV